MAAQHTTSSPDCSRPNSVVEVAAMPDENTSEASAPSMAASFCSTATTVGLS